MADHDDDDFVNNLMARIKQRQTKLAGDNYGDSTSGDVSYPPLSPLPEEVSTINEEGDDDESNTLDKVENVSPGDSDLNYSSDLSLECETEPVVYRAEPVVTHRSPDNIQLSPTKQHHIQPAPRYATLRKPIPTAPQTPQHVEAQAPLHERQIEHKPTSSQSLPGTTPTEISLKEFEQRASRAEQTKMQLRKAVEVSKRGTDEHIEAARLMLIAEKEHLSLTNCVANHKQGYRKNTDSLGSIVISNIHMRMSNRLRDELAEEGVHHFFLCIASYGPDVKATGIVNTNDIRRQDLKSYVMFKDTLSFCDLPPDFSIKLEIFELILGHQQHKLLSKLTPSKKTKIAPEGFKRIGSMKLKLEDRNMCTKHLTQWSKLEESKYIERECKLHIELKPEQLPSKSGMLHVRFLDHNKRPDWSRFYVDSSNNQMCFWRSKQDAVDERKPNLVLEFRDLCSTTCQKLTPDDALYRQNSFVVYTYQQVCGGDEDTLFQRIMKDEPKYKIVKHQLAAENKEDRDSWCAVLDKSMQCFRQWHAITKIFSIPELDEIFSSSY